MEICRPCADPESFARGGPNLTMFFLYFCFVLVTEDGRENSTKNGPSSARQRNAITEGAQWLSDRVFDTRPKGRGFEPHRRHCVLSLSKNINPSLVMVQPRKTRPYITESC